MKRLMVFLLTIAAFLAMAANVLADTVKMG
jgi:hypothetical protein